MSTWSGFVLRGMNAPFLEPRFFSRFARNFRIEYAPSQAIRDCNSQVNYTSPGAPDNEEEKSRDHRLRATADRDAGRASDLPGLPNQYRAADDAAGWLARSGR